MLYADGTAELICHSYSGAQPTWPSIETCMFRFEFHSPFGLASLHLVWVICETDAIRAMSPMSDFVKKA
ncbi:hypothetical protein Poly51_47780 [Rubripirellula tenax]|uniref:Uncharacterized protein n=1 Tax=Rubripirellula tenax TaxID=2528015 RepID=A0A5C6EJZ1_9BACT|nr:hypothetical protein Poly51_47780 [Rubripirellula tenax]